MFTTDEHLLEISKYEQNKLNFILTGSSLYRHPNAVKHRNSMNNCVYDVINKILLKLRYFVYFL